MSKIITNTHTAYGNLDDYAGKRASVTVDDLVIDVTVTKARARFGHLDLLVTPVAGGGEQWIEQHRVQFN